LGLGRIVSLQTGQTGGNTVAEKRVDFGYNALGEFTSIARYKDTDGGMVNEVATSTFTYDTLGRLTGLAYAKGGTNLFTPYAWTYDSLSSPGFGGAQTSVAADPRVAATAAMPAMPSLGSVTQMTGQDGTSDYGYDNSSQLTSAVHSFQMDESYSYDANGNRTMMGYQTGTDNRLLNDGTYSYQYDKEGNRTKRTKTSTNESTEYQWKGATPLFAGHWAKWITQFRTAVRSVTDWTNEAARGADGKLTVYPKFSRNIRAICRHGVAIRIPANAEASSSFAWIATRSGVAPIQPE